MANEPIRILIFGMHDKIGGVETFIMNYYRNIDRKNVQFDFINMFDNLCFEKEILSLGGKIYKVPNVKRNPIGYYKEIKKIIKENKYQIVHINMLSMANVLPINVAKKTGVKHIIVHSHNSNTPKGLLRKILDRINKNIVLKKATDFWACSRKAGDWMFEGKKEFIVINNAIDIKKFAFNKEKREKIRRDMNIQEKFVIGHVGRFSEQKNHQFLIDMYAELTKRENKSILVLIGEGELKKEIIEKVNQYGIEARVKFQGITERVEDFYQAMDLFVLPSKFEGLPVVGVEVQTNGLPCLFSQNITREISLSDNATFLKIDDKNEWIKKILELERTSQRRDITENVSKKGYDILCESKRLEEMYQKMI